MGKVIKCNKCGSVLSDGDPPKNLCQCPNCGSKNIMYKLHLSDTARVYEQIRGKVKAPGKKKPLREFVHGDEKTKTKGIWVEKKRVIDRVNDWYEEKVADKETGEIYHNCSEPLSQHFGHGSAKYKKR